MPAIVVYVQRVDEAPTRLDGLTNYLVTAAETVEGLPTFQARTLNWLIASLCERARALHRPASILWKDGRYGKQIVHVDLLTPGAVG